MTTSDILTAILKSVEHDENKFSFEVEGILEYLIGHSKAGDIVSRWARVRTMATLGSEVANLVQRANGLHFTAKKTTAERLREFDIDVLASKMSTLAPNLWSLFGSLLTADPTINYKREWTRKNVTAPDNVWRTDDQDIDMLDVHEPDEDEDQYWKDVDESPLVGDEDDEPEDAEDQKKQRSERIAMTVSVE